MARTISIAAARRIALGAQGFARKAPRGPVGPRHFDRVMRELGLIQLDSVNVCARTHYMPFYSRLGAYQQEALDEWLNASGKHFEYWAHEASVMPVESYPLWRWKMQIMKPWKSAQAIMKEHPKLKAAVLAQVRERGPLTVRELEAPKKRTRPWWGYGPGKVALEVLFSEGALTAVRTGNFTRLYDLPERAIPKPLLEDRRHDAESAQRQLLLDALRHHGIGTARDIADYYRLKMPAARPILASLVAEGAIEEVQVQGWKEPAYRDPAAACPREIRGAALLSPFDPVAWFRDRGERLFDFHYRLEIYTPAEKRVHGYYVLPFMLDGELVGRVDLKADRKDSRLLVQSAFVEAGQDKVRVAAALAEELQRFAAWLGLASIRLGQKGDLMRALRAAL